MTENVKEITDFPLPFNKTVTLKDVEFEGGFKMVRMTLREGRRFTMIDLDPASAEKLGNELSVWAGQNTNQT